MWCLENGYIDGALVSFLEGDKAGWKARPGVATNRDEVLASAGSPLHLLGQHPRLPRGDRAGAQGAGAGRHVCQTSIGPVMWHRKVGKVGRPIKLNIGLLCSKSFDDSLFDELFWLKYGLAKDRITKMNIKGVFQVWMDDGGYHEINLKECHAWTREGCLHCPDFAAEHADISTGGIGDATDWTLTDRPHRPRPGDHRADAGGRRHRGQARRLRPRRHRARCTAWPSSPGPAGPSGPSSGSVSASRPAPRATTERRRDRRWPPE